MARLASQEKMMYVPTPETTIPMIAKHIQQGYNPTPGTIFDPCCGTALAIRLLADQLGKEWKVYGVELDQERASEADIILGGNILNASIQDTHVEGQCDILFLNPPYDHDALHGARMEHLFLRWTSRYLREDGLLVYIVKEEFVGKGKHAEETYSILKAQNYGSVKTYRFPEPEYTAYSQVVLFAKKQNYGYVSPDSQRVMGVLGSVPPRSDRDYWSHIIHLNRVAGERMSMVKKFSLAYEPSILATDENALNAYIGEPGTDGGDLTPLTGLKETNAVLLACSGMLNNATVGGMVVKGGTFIRAVKADEERREDGGREWKIVQKTPVEFTVLNLESGQIEVFNEIDQKERYNQFLLDHARSFVDTCMAHYPPIYHANGDLVDFSHIRPPKILPGREDVRGMLPQQEHVASAVIHGLDHHKIINIIAQMGTGKTVQSIGATYTYVKNKGWDNKKIIVMIPSSPEDLYRKWMEEIEVILRDHKDVWCAHVTTITDVQKAFARPGIGFIILREYYAKSSSPWLTVEPLKKKFIYLVDGQDGKSVRKVGYRWHCPGCGERLHDDEVEELMTNFEKEEEAVKEGKGRHSAKGRKQIKCRTIWPEHDDEAEEPLKKGCGFTFWTRMRPKTESGNLAKPEYPLARYIRDHYPRQFILILDEAHEYKGGDAGRGYASQDLISSSLRGIQMTGTFFNGKASGIFYMLYRSSPEFRKLYQYTEMTKFVKRYGVEEMVMKEVPQKSGGSTISGYRLIEGAPREAPGLHPSLAALILPNTVFLTKHDLDFDLVPYSEHTLYMEMDKAHREAYDRYINAVESRAKSYLTSFDAEQMKLGRALYSYLMYAKNGLLDRPDAGETCPNEPIEYKPAAPPEGGLYPKEEALVRLVLREKKRNRRCLVYVHQMVARDPSERLVKALLKYGIKAAVMKANVKKRIDFIREAISNGCDVVITNHQLVKVGIDLVETPTVIWYSLEKQMNTLEIPQANERPHRIHQTEAVEVYYFGYNETVQAETAQYVAKKVGVMQRFQGDIQTGLAALEVEADLVDDIQKLVADREHYESDVSVDDLPPLEAWKAPPRKRANNGYKKFEEYYVEHAQVEIKEVSRATKNKDESVIQYGFF